MKVLILATALVSSSAFAQFNVGNTAAWADTLQGRPQQHAPQIQFNMQPAPQIEKQWFPAPAPIQVPRQITYQQIGDFTYGSDGSTAQRIGNQIYVTPGRR